MKITPFRPELDVAKLHNLILYVAERCLCDEHFGKAKLNKVLWMSEFHHYALWGEPIAGGAFLQERHGPVLKDLDAHLRDLQNQERIRMRLRDRFGKSQQRPVSLQQADLGEFSGREIAAVEDIIHEVRNLTAAEVVEMSKAHPAFRAANIGEEIPYAIALIPYDVDDDDDYGHPAVWEAKSA